MYDRVFYVIAGAVVTWIFQQYRIVRSEEITLLNEHISDIKSLSEASQNYWLTQPKDGQEELSLAAKVRANHAATNLLYNEVSQICDRRSSDYQKLSFELFQIATGEDFESVKRKIDPVRAIDCANKASELIHLLRITRTDIISLARLIRKANNKIHVVYQRISDIIRNAATE